MRIVMYLIGSVMGFKMLSKVLKVRQVIELYSEPTQVNRVTTVRSVLFEAVGSTATALRAIGHLAFRFAAVSAWFLGHRHHRLK